MWQTPLEFKFFPLKTFVLEDFTHPKSSLYIYSLTNNVPPNSEEYKLLSVYFIESDPPVKSPPKVL